MLKSYRCCCRLIVILLQAKLMASNKSSFDVASLSNIMSVAWAVLKLRTRFELRSKLIAIIPASNGSFKLMSISFFVAVLKLTGITIAVFKPSTLCFIVGGDLRQSVSRCICAFCCLCYQIKHSRRTYKLLGCDAVQKETRFTRYNIWYVRHTCCIYIQ